MPSSNFRNMRFYSEDEVQKIADDLERAIAIPVNTRVEGEHRVYDFSEMREILEQAERITVHDCGCKTEYGNCDAPKDVCLGLDVAADEPLEDELHGSRELDIENALEVLQRSHDSGLVHLAYVMMGEDKPGLVCSCCPCCCHTLGSLVRKGRHTEIMTSKYIAANDAELCKSCGKCVDRCVFQARQMDAGKLVYNQSMCFGCGLCVSTCSDGAIRLIPRMG